MSGVGNGDFIGCFNTGYIHSTSFIAAGIAGSFDGGNVINCYNKGTITSKTNVGGIAGCSGYGRSAKIINSYNLGSVSVTSSYVGQIVGYLYSGHSQSNCYTTNATVDLLNANDYSKDENGEYVWTNDVQNPDDGTWKYNNGYPILKWQIQP